MKNHHKLWTIISLIIVFSAGLISGVLLDNYVIKPKRRPERTEYRRTSPSRYPTLDQWAQELELTPEQKQKIQEIFKNNEERFRALRKDMNESLRDIRIQLNNEIKSVLTEDQQAKYEAMINQHHSQRKGELEKKKRQSDGQNKGEKR
ncbi:Spy/CpxP family protein refolding chaperone [Acidobacteriota bacterium]